MSLFNDLVLIKGDFEIDQTLLVFLQNYMKYLVMIYVLREPS